MKSLIAAIILVTISNAQAASSITGIGGYGGFRNRGPETIRMITEQIERECLIMRRAKLLTKIECMKLDSTETIYRICSATCSSGSNLFITSDGDKIPKVKK